MPRRALGSVLSLNKGTEMKYLVVAVAFFILHGCSSTKTVSPRPNSEEAQYYKDLMHCKMIASSSAAPDQQESFVSICMRGKGWQPNK